MSRVAKTRGEILFHLLGIAASSFGVLMLGLLLVDIVLDGFHRLNPEFFYQFPLEAPCQGWYRGSSGG